MAQHDTGSTNAEKYLQEIDILLKVPGSEPQKQVSRASIGVQGMNRSTKLLHTSDRMEEQRQPVQRLAYLDGLRGFAALLVYVLHFEVGSRNLLGMVILESAFGAEGRYHFVTLPGLRIFFTGGHFAVTTFFVISGYVLSNNLLKMIHDGSIKVVDKISSALFRRWFRLFIPVFATTFVWMASWHAFDIKPHPEKEGSFCDELWLWYCTMKNYSFTFENNIYINYNYHVWSIPLEFRGSLLVYTTLLALRNASTKMRLACEAGLAWYFMYITDAWYCTAFMVGMLLSDLDLLTESGDLPATLKRWWPKSTWFYAVLFLCSMYLGGVPSLKSDLEWFRSQPGWHWLSYLKPQAAYDIRFFFRVVASIFLMISIPRLQPLKTFFETRFCQYLGRISYGFYLVHGCIQWSIGARLYAMSGRVHETHVETAPGWQNYMPLPDFGPFGLEFNLLVPQLVLFPLTLWVADVVTHVIDEPSVRFAQWLYKVVLKSDEPEMKRKAEQIV